jgi:hypothetical protein
LGSVTQSQKVLAPSYQQVLNAIALIPAQAVAASEI